MPEENDHGMDKTFNDVFGSPEKKVEQKESGIKSIKITDKKMKYNGWKFISLGLTLLLIVSVFTNGFSFGGLSKDAAAEKTIGFVNTNLLQGQAVAELSEVTDGDSEGLYNLKLDINGQIIDGYVTKDGKLFFPQAINLEDATLGTDSQTAPPADLPKTDKPVVELFVMSHCPYGTQAEKGILPVVDLLGDKIDFEIKFVSYAMHGQKELNEQMNQVCIQSEQTSKFNDYLTCFLTDGNGERCLTAAKIDTDKLESCVSKLDAKYNITELFNDESTWLSGQFPLFNVYKTENDQYGVQGSPTLVVNGEQASSERSPDAYLKTICAAFTTAPAECAQTLSTTQASAGFGAGAATSGDAGCGV